MVHVPNVDTCHAHTYVDNYIPAPFVARISHDVSMDGLLFKPRNLLDESHANGRILTTREHYEQAKHMRDIIDLTSFTEVIQDIFGRWNERVVGLPPRVSVPQHLLVWIIIQVSTDAGGARSGGVP